SPTLKFRSAMRQKSALSPLESALTQRTPVTPLESALTIYIGGGVPWRAATSLGADDESASHGSAEMIPYWSPKTNSSTFRRPAALRDRALQNRIDQKRVIELRRVARVLPRDR